MGTAANRTDDAAIDDNRADGGGMGSHQIPFWPMPRRIEIELTSARPDGTWTWRVAGAREPRGVLDGSLLPADAKTGSVLKADAEVELEGYTILSVASAKEKAAKSGLLD